MKKGLTELVCIVDCSGSMMHLVDDTIGGINNVISEQKKVTDGEANLTLVTFGSIVETQLDNIPLAEVSDAKEYYQINGMTAMLDGIGMTITKVGNRLAKTPEAERPENVIVTIITDGQENSSQEYNASQIKEMIKLQESTYNWEFVFLGANIDAATEASNIGININNAMQYGATAKGMTNTYSKMSAKFASVRSVGANSNVSLSMNSLQDLSND